MSQQRIIHLYVSNKTKEKDFGFLGLTNCRKASILMEEKGQCQQGLRCRFLWCHVWVMKVQSCPLWLISVLHNIEGRETPLQIYALLLANREGRGFFMCPLFLILFRLNIINIPKWHNLLLIIGIQNMCYFSFY